MNRRSFASIRPRLRQGSRVEARPNTAVAARRTPAWNGPGRLLGLVLVLVQQPT